MKCTSCVSGARPKSDDEEAAVSPSPTMDKEEYRVESPPPPPLPERSSRIPSVSIVELPADFQRNSPAPSGSSQLLRPLDVITEETSDVSDSENRPPPSDLCFPRPKPRFKKPKSKNLLKNLLRQEPTTCVLVDAKIAEAAPEEYRSVCTTEVVPEQILEVEVIDLGSNSSSLADLTDIDDLDPDKVNNNEEPPPPIDSPKHPDDNDNDNESIVGASLSEEDNNGYDESSTQTPHDDACTQNANDADHHDDDHHEENDRTESDRDDEEAATAERSLAADVDRVVTQCRNVSEVKDQDDRDDDDDDRGSSSDCCSEEQDVTHPAIGESLVTTTEDCDSMGEEEAPPEVPPRPPPPPAAAVMPQVVEPPTAAVTNLGQDEVHERRPHDAQVPAGGDTGEADPADADQSREEDSGDAVVVPSDSSVLLKLLQDPVAVEKRPTSVPDQISRAENCVGAAPAGTKIERAVKSEQLNYEIVQDHRVLREETVTNSSSAASEVILRRKPSNDRNESPKEPSPEQKAALVHDLRNEISRIKDAELQEEFRKLELEAARIERDLNNMAVVPPPAENLTYYVSKQNDFAVERPPPPAVLPRQKPPAPTPPTPPPKPTQIPSSPSSNDLMYNEWQAKMEEREARRLHKVVKLAPNKPDTAQPEPSEDPNLGDEFLRKVKDRRRKFTIPGDSDPDTDTGSTPGTPIAGRKPVPKHIEQEFAEFAKLRKQQQQEEATDEKPGVWSPHNRSTEILTKSELAERSRDQQQQQQSRDPPVWTPRSAPPSPASERREFRPIGFESPTPQRRNQPSSATPPPWTTSPGYEKPVEFSSKPNVSPATTRPEPTPLQNSNSQPSIGGHSVRFASLQQQQQIARQQTVPSPTINSLLKSKDGKVGQQVSTFESVSNQSNVYQTSASQRTTNQQTTYQRSGSGTRLGGRTGEISQPGRQVDYLSEPESVTDHQQQQQQRNTPTMAQLSPRKVDGIGPMTREGMPLTLRSVRNFVSRGMMSIG